MSLGKSRGSEGRNEGEIAAERWEEEDIFDDNLAEILIYRKKVVFLPFDYTTQGGQY
ncbi:MAG: hypothetical protein MJZ77_02340 [Bacteroidales bacterium]|nr:hypothetical protein [Bacteroidales bacterium]